MTKNQAQPTSTPSPLLVLCLLAYLPYAEMLNDFFPFKLLGASLLITVLPTAALVFAFFLEGTHGNVSICGPASMFAVAVGIASIRAYLGLSSADLITSLVGSRYIMLIPLYMAVLQCAGRDRTFVRCASTIILTNGAIAALVGILYSLSIIRYHVTPVDITTVDYALYSSGEQMRGAGLFSGSNIYGNFLVLPMLLSVQTSMTIRLRVALCSVLGLGIISSESREAVIALLIIIAATVARSGRGSSVKRGIFVAVTLLAIVAAWNVNLPLLNGIRGRFARTDLSEENRTAKAIIGVTAVGKGWETVLLGAYDDDLVLGNAEVMKFTDNSFLLTCTSVGVPAAVTFFAFVGYRMRMGCSCGRLFSWMLMGIVICMALLTNNAILWDMWVLHLLAVHQIIYRRKLNEHWRTGGPAEARLKLAG